jgi:hypothetical protein
MILQKIISGGQTGADQGALDAAIKLGFPYGGWIPKGRRTEDGPLPCRYVLSETKSSDYADHTGKNILASDGTLILCHGPLTGGSKLTQELACHHGKPVIHFDLEQTPVFLAPTDIRKWVIEHNVGVLNVAGPRASDDPRIYDDAFYVTEGVILLEMVGQEYLADVDADDFFDKFPLPPKTVEEAVDRFIDDLDLKNRVIIAKMGLDDLVQLHHYLDGYFTNVFDLSDGANSELIESCNVHSAPLIDKLRLIFSSFMER